MNRDGIWGVYVIMNALAIFFNSSLLFSIWRLKEKKTSTEVLIGSLSSGILIAALGCGPQCLMSTVVGTFAFGNRACFIEAYLHLVGMEVQFMSVAAISHRTYIGVVKLTPYSANKALAIVAFAWCFAIFTTTLMGYFSDYYLVASGTFCFYEWTSPALVFAAWPMAIICLLLMGYWYWKTYQAFQNVREGAKVWRKEQNQDSSSLDRDLAIRLGVLVIFFLFGYIGIISQSLYEIFIGRAKAWGDIVAALMVLTYWDCIAFCYAKANKRLGLNSILFMVPQRLMSKVQPKSKDGSTSPGLSTSGEESDATPKFLLTIFKSQKSKAQGSPGELELATPPDLLGPSLPHGTGSARLEGPKEYEPFLPVGDDDLEQRLDQSAPSKQIFNPFYPQSSPSYCTEFEFPSIRHSATTDQPSNISSDQSTITIITTGPSPRETPRSAVRHYTEPVSMASNLEVHPFHSNSVTPLASPSSLPPVRPFYSESISTRPVPQIDSDLSSLPPDPEQESPLASPSSLPPERRFAESISPSPSTEMLQIYSDSTPPRISPPATPNSRIVEESS